MKKLIFPLIIMMLLSVSCKIGGASFDNKADFVSYQEREGYVILGQFGDSWPARIVEEQTAMDEIAFTLKSGAKQSYPGYTGYELKMVRLASDNDEETVLVLRAKDKQ